MWKLQRYFLKEILLGSVLVFSILFGIVLISTIPRGLQKATGYELVDALRITLLWTIDAIPHLLPVAPLFAIVLTYARASQEREITAIRAAGISPRTAMVPALLVGIVFSLLTSGMVHYIVPWAHYEKNRVVTETVRTMLIRTGMLEDRLDFSGVMMTWEGQDDAGRWTDVTIALDDPDAGSRPFGTEGLVTAERAWIEMTPDHHGLSLVLRGARSYGAHPAYLGESRINVDLQSLIRRWMRVEQAKDLATDQLLAEVYRGALEDELGALYLAHRRSCFASLPILFAPIGFVIGVLSRERGRMTALLFSLCPVLLAYASDVFAESLVDPVGSPWIAWLPAALLIMTGLPFCWQFWRF